MKKPMYLVALMFLTACGGESESTKKGDHVWKAQTDALEQARAAANAASEEAAVRARRLEQETE